MTIAIPTHDAAVQPRREAATLFDHRRGDMLNAWRAACRHMTDAEVEQEIMATASAMAQMARVVR